MSHFRCNCRPDVVVLRIELREFVKAWQLFLHPICSQPLSVNLVALLLSRPLLVIFIIINCTFIFAFSFLFLISSQFLLEFCLLSLSRSNCVYCSFYHCIVSIYSAVKLLVFFNKLTVTVICCGPVFVRLSVSMIQVGVLPKWLYVG